MELYSEHIKSTGEQKKRNKIGFILRLWELRSMTVHDRPIHEGWFLGNKFCSKNIAVSDNCNAYIDNLIN